MLTLCQKEKSLFLQGSYGTEKLSLSLFFLMQEKSLYSGSFFFFLRVLTFAIQVLLFCSFYPIYRKARQAINNTKMQLLGHAKPNGHFYWFDAKFNIYFLVEKNLIRIVNSSNGMIAQVSLHAHLWNLARPCFWTFINCKTLFSYFFFNLSLNDCQISEFVEAENKKP